MRGMQLECAQWVLELAFRLGCLSAHAERVGHAAKGRRVASSCQLRHQRMAERTVVMPCAGRMFAAVAQQCEVSWLPADSRTETAFCTISQRVTPKRDARRAGGSLLVSIEPLPTNAPQSFRGHETRGRDGRHRPTVGLIWRW